MLYGLFGLLFPNCTPSTDTGWDTGPPNVVLTNVRIDCNAIAWEYQVFVVGDPGEADLYFERFSGSDSYGETHPLPPAVFDDLNQEFVYTLPLDIVANESDVVPGETSAISCAIPATNWRVDLYDASGAYASCAVFGEDITRLDSNNCVVLQIN